MRRRWPALPAGHHALRRALDSGRRRRERCSAHQARMSSRRLEGESRLLVIGTLLPHYVPQSVASGSLTPPDADLPTAFHSQFVLTTLRKFLQSAAVSQSVTAGAGCGCVPQCRRRARPVCVCRSGNCCRHISALGLSPKLLQPIEKAFPTSLSQLI